VRTGEESHGYGDRTTARASASALVYTRTVLVPGVLDSYLDSIPTAISGYIAFKGATTAVTGYAFSAYVDLVARPRETHAWDRTQPIWHN
jgi:hypothetical protein